MLRFDREGYLSLFGEEEHHESRGFASEMANTMVFVRLCEYHLYEEKKLKWNQHNMGGLFVYCQNILARSEEHFWSPPHHNKQDGVELSTPYKAYLNYVKHNDLKAQQSQQVVYSVENRMVKYECWREQEQSAIRERSGGERGRGVHPVVKSVVEFFLPWMKSLPQEDSKSTAKNGFRIGAKPLPDLECLFGREPSLGLPVGFEETLKELRERRDSVVDYRRVERRKRGERASV